MHFLCLIVGIALMGVAPSLEALSMADNLRGCFANIEDQTLNAVIPSNAKLLELLDKAEVGRQMIDNCQSANPTNPNFAWCVANQAEGLRVDSLKALDGLQRELTQLSNRMAAIVNEAVDCVSRRLQGGKSSGNGHAILADNSPALHDKSKILLAHNVLN